MPGEMFGRRVANAVRTPRSMYRDDGRWGERLRKRVRRFFAASAARTALRMTRKSALFAIVIPAQAGIQVREFRAATSSDEITPGALPAGSAISALQALTAAKPQRGEIPQPGSQGRATVRPKRIAR